MILGSCHGLLRAKSVVEHMTLENMAGMLDVKKQVMELGKRISDWNGEPFH